MKHYISFSSLFVTGFLCLCLSTSTFSNGPSGKQFGFGLIIGEPMGGTVKYWLNKDQAIVGDIGPSYFGMPRLQADYLWHFDAFSSKLFSLYAGPGLGLGFGRDGRGWYYKDSKGHWYHRDSDFIGVCVRGIVGVNFVPRGSSFEIFLEMGPNIGVVPGFGSAFDIGLGVRYYP